MAKGQYLTGHQRAIVNRYYAHADTRTLAAVQELVSDLAVASPGPAADKLWKKVPDVFSRCGAEAARVEPAVKARDVKALAVIAGELLRR